MNYHRNQYSKLIKGVIKMAKKLKVEEIIELISVC